ncbi:MAG: alpha/beta hydrolase [Clostridiales bacterium]|mgnify:CR=1 FL=1|nr:alpha/beta hydrolase [Clostridiales bacterium]
MLEQYLTLRDGKRIFMRYYNELPAAKTILFLHGGPGVHCEDFNCAAHYLSNSFNIVMFDQRGVLRSDRVEDHEPLNVQILVDDCEDIRKQLNIDKWILLGHSFGGFLALLYAWQYPSHIDKVIYENTSWYCIDSIKTIHKKTSAYLRTINEHRLADKIDSVISVCDDFETLIQLQYDTPEKFRQQVYYNKPLSEEIKKHWHLQNVTQQQWENGIIHNKRIVADKILYQDLQPLIKEVTCPSLLIRGEYDPCMSEEQQEYFVKNSPNGKLCIVADCGHTVHTDNVTEFCKIVKEFAD